MFRLVIHGKRQHQVRSWLQHHLPSLNHHRRESFADHQCVALSGVYNCEHWLSPPTLLVKVTPDQCRPLQQESESVTVALFPFHLMYSLSSRLIHHLEPDCTLAFTLPINFLPHRHSMEVVIEGAWTCPSRYELWTGSSWMEDVTLDPDILCNRKLLSGSWCRHSVEINTVVMFTAGNWHSIPKLLIY